MTWELLLLVFQLFFSFSNHITFIILKRWLLQLRLPKAKGCWDRAGPCAPLTAAPTQPDSPRPDGDKHGHGQGCPVGPMGMGTGLSLSTVGS